MPNLPWWSNLLAALVALIPALLSAWWGRALVRMQEDAAIGERLLAHRRRILGLTIIVAVILAICVPRTLIWSLPLLILFRAIAAFPVRRSLFGETWNLAKYLLGGFRLYVALLGFWILLAACPFLTTGDHWWVTVLIFAILVLWNWRYADAVLRLLGARPLHSEALKTRFARVVECSKVTAPSVWRAGPAGATFANALALPSAKKPSVLFSETLLERLSEEETTAIFAHEIAHLEHYNRSRLRLANIAVLGLIITGVFFIPIVQRTAEQWAVYANGIWPCFVLLCLAFRARHAQANEQSSDLRAVELCGNAEALVNALIKLHAIGRLPRRWELRMEESASHPSLAHRIRAIRNAVPPLSEPPWCEIFRTAEQGAFVALDRDGLREFRSVPAECAETMEALQSAAGAFSSIRFSQIAELRVAAMGESDPELKVIDCNGERRALQMRAEDLSRLQRTLDRVDVLLPPAPKSLFAGRQLASISASAAAVAALLGGQLWSVTFVALAAAFRPSVRLITAVAMVSTLSLVLVIARGTIEPGYRLVTIAGILPLASVALWMFFHLRRESLAATERLPRWILWALGAAAIVCLGVPFLAAQGSLLSLSRISKTAVAPVVLPLTMAILFIWERKSRIRGLAVFFGIAGCASIVLGTQWFRDRIVRDPLASSFPELRVSTLPSEEIAHFPVESWASEVRIAPQGTFVAVRYGDSEDEEDSLSCAIYEKNGIRRNTVEALDLRFIDESHMLALSAAPSGLALDLIGADKSSSPIWRSPPDSIVQWGRLAVAPETGEWRILSVTREGNLVRFQGFVGSNGMTRTEWAPPIAAEPWANHGTSGSGPASVWVHQSWKANQSRLKAALLPYLSGEYPVESSLFIGRRGDMSLVMRSGAQVTCLDPPVGEDKAICFAFYDGTTNVLELDPSKGTSLLLGSMKGSAWSGEFDSSEIVAFSLSGTPAILQIRTRHLYRLAFPPEVTSLGAACRTGIIAVLANGQGRATVTISRLSLKL